MPQTLVEEIEKKPKKPRTLTTSECYERTPMTLCGTSICQIRMCFT